jgi:hypothetical protein
MDRTEPGEGSKAAIRTGHHTLTPNDARETLEPFGHEFWMFNKICGRAFDLARPAIRVRDADCNSRAATLAVWLS